MQGRTLTERERESGNRVKCKRKSTAIAIIGCGGPYGCEKPRLSHVLYNIESYTTYYTTSRKVGGSIPDEIIGFFN
jgi:hypothetical protein